MHSLPDDEEISQLVDRLVFGEENEELVVRRIEKMDEAISDRNRPVVHQLGGIVNELDEISQLKRSLV